MKFDKVIVNDNDVYIGYDNWSMSSTVLDDDMEWSTKEAKVVSKTESSADNTVNMDSSVLS